MSVNVVVPPSSISRAPRRVPQRTKSADTFFASAGKMNFSSQSCSRMSSAMPRKRDMAAWVCVLISPGARIASGRSSRCFGWKRPSISDLAPTPTIRSPRMAIAPFGMTRCCPSSVMTYRALQTQSAASAKRLTAETQRTQRILRERNEYFLSANLRGGLRLCRELKKGDIEGLGEELFQLVRFGLPAGVYQDDF